MPIQVVIVDDSTVIREVLKSILNSDAGIEVVGTASNGQSAIAVCQEKQPDVCILDVEMPVLDGISALKQLREKIPDMAVIMCSTLTQKNAEITMKALELGAMDSIAKPSSSSELNSKEGFQKNLLELVRSVGALGRLKLSSSRKSTSPAPQSTKQSGDKPSPLAAWRPKMVMIGSSTGGPQALFAVLEGLKGKKSAPIVITQHMPPTFTKTLAEHITKKTGLTCFEAEDGMPVEAGKAYLARGGEHMTVKKKGTSLVLSLNKEAPEHFCRPSVEPMFRSVMDIYQPKELLGVILTGMGSDGVHASTKLAEEGGFVVAQDEESSVVWGMPGAVVKAKAACEILPLNEIGPWIGRHMN